MNELPTRKNQADKPKKQPAAKAEPKKSLFKTNGKMPVAEVPIQVPMAEYVPPSTHCQRNFMVRLTVEQAANMSRLVDGLRHRGVQLSDGHPVDGPQNAIRWLCEQTGQS